ncbi:MAG TPA: acyl-CoA dehydrogenase family protein, partial [Micromonosporaceae bacterium]|nr:acyl-CoA dehydrogenase family protein [Micromonosporaceae bacterium]
ATDAASAGSDLINLGTRVDLAPDALTVHGGKRWITNACSADWLLVLGRHRPQPHFTSLVWALVPAAAPGVRATPAGDTMFAGAAVGHLSFDRVTLGRDHLAGTPGLGLAVFGRHVTTERLAGALWAGARTRRVLAATLDRLITRHLGDQPMWANPAIRERFSRCLMHWWRLDELTARFAGQLDEPTSLVSSMLLKATVAEAVDAILGECARLHGADAFVAQGLAHLRAESAMFGIAGGAADAMLAGVADSAGSLLAARGRPATGPTRPPDPPAAQPPAAQPATAARPGGWL